MDDPRATGPLAGRRIVVTRAAEQAGTLANRLAARGAEVLEVPTIEVVDAADGGRAVDAAVRSLATGTHAYDWVVVTSVNGARRVIDAWVRTKLDGARDAFPARLAAVGPGTAAVLDGAGWRDVLVPERAVAEGLLEVFPAPPPGGGRVLLAQAEAARPVLADGLRGAGWEVDAVVAYRTVPARPSPDVVAAAAAADAITFTSGSTVDGYLTAAGRDAVPPVVVCIGPVTAAVAEKAGLRVTRVATAHTLDGLVTAVVDALAGGQPGAGGRAGDV